MASLGSSVVQLAHHVEARRAGHAQVDDRHLGRVLLRQPQAALGSRPPRAPRSRAREGARQPLAQHVVVVDDQEARAPAGSSAEPPSAGRAPAISTVAVVPWPGRRLQVEPAAHLLGERAGEEEAEPDALARRLGREERLADAGQDVRRHAAALVRDAHDAASRPSPPPRASRGPPPASKAFCSRLCDDLHERAAAERSAPRPGFGTSTRSRSRCAGGNRGRSPPPPAPRPPPPAPRRAGWPESAASRLRIARQRSSSDRIRLRVLDEGATPAPREARGPPAPAPGWRPRWWRAACRARGPPRPRVSSPPPAARCRAARSRISAIASSRRSRAEESFTTK